MENEKKIPNPYGRKGGPKHQAKVIEVAAEVKSYLISIVTILRMMKMESKQINFYFMPDDLSEIDQYIKEKGLSVYNNYSGNENLQKLDSLLQTKVFGKLSSIKYITHKDLVKDVKNEFVEKQDYYSIDVFSSPVVEIFTPKTIISNNIIHSGRVYYIYNYYNKDSLTSKSEEFIKIASDLFKWIKKNFKNVKLPGYEAYLISERTHSWIKSSGGKLADMVREDEFKKKIVVA